MRKIVFLFVSFLCVVSVLFLVGYESNAEDEADELQAIHVDIGNWRYELRSDNTASIIGILNSDYLYNQEFKQNKKTVVDDIPESVVYHDIRYTVVELGSKLFYGFEGLAKPIMKVRDMYPTYFTSVIIPSSIKKIGDGAFANNGGIFNNNQIKITVSFNNNEKLVIGDGAFARSRVILEGLSSIQTLEIGKSSFQDAYLYMKSFEGDNPVFDLHNVDVVGENAFGGRSGQTVFYKNDTFTQKCNAISIDLSNANYISDRAFKSTTSSKITLSLNKSCKFENHSFDACSIGLEPEISSTGSFEILDGVLLNYTPNVSDSDTLVVSKNVKTIRSGLFNNSKTIKHISVEENSQLVSIEKEAFSGSALESVDLSNATMLQNIGQFAFYKCNSLVTLNIEKCTKLEYIGVDAFNSTCLTALNLPRSLKIIEERAFMAVPLQVIDLSNQTSLLSIGDNAFSNGTAIGVKEEFKGEYNTKIIDLSGSVNLRQIGAEAFFGIASEGAEVTLRGCSSLSSIGDHAFYSRDIEKTINEGGSSVYTNVPKVYSVDITGCCSIENLGTDAFSECKFDDSVPMLVKGQCRGIANLIEGKLLIKSDDFAINPNALNGVSEIELSDGCRFSFENGILSDKYQNNIFKVVGVERLVIPATVKNVYVNALKGCSALNTVIIQKNIGLDWLSEYSGMIFVDAGADETIESLERVGRQFLLRAESEGCEVTVSTELGFEFAKPKLKIDGKTVNVDLVYSGGYTDHDVMISDGSREFMAGQWDFQIADGLHLIIKAIPRTGIDNVKVIFELDGGTYEEAQSKTIEISKGLTLLDSDLFVPYRDTYVFAGWALKGSDIDFDYDSPVVTDITLVARWAYVGASISFNTPYGEISANKAGHSFESGGVLKEGSVTLSFYPFPGYTFKAWVVGDDRVTSRDLEVSAPESDLSISVDVDGYSADSLKSLVFDNKAIDLSDYSLSWTFGGVVNTSMANWTGHPSNPVIAGDHVYVRINDEVYQLSLETGMITGSFSSITQTDFYHHLGYGNGMLVDYATGKVYDDDLNHLYNLTGGTISYAYYDNGQFICMLDGVPAAFDATDKSGVVEDKTCLWKSSESRWFKLYGSVSTPVFYDGYMYAVCVKGMDTFLTSISLKDGSVKDSVQLSKLHGAYLDDGWISLHDGTIYLTSYAYGLFGATQADIKAAFVSSIKIDNGVFNKDTLVYTELKGYDSLTSQFVVFNGRGYVYTCSFSGKQSALLVFDIEDMRLIEEYRTKNNVTHGSIVIDASAFDATKKIQIYLLAYNDAKLHVYQDDFSKSTGSVSCISISGKNYGLFGGTYCSQAVRFGQNGEMLWYDDSGYLQCYSPSINRYVFISEGEDAKWYLSSGKTVSDSFKSLGSDVLTLDDKTKTLTSVNGKTGNWDLYCLQYSSSTKTYNWVKINDLADAVLDKQHYFAVVKGELPLWVTYTYLTDNGLKVYKFSTSGIPSDVVGKEMKASTDVISISFTDPKGVLVDSAYLVVKNQEFVVEYPVASRAGFSAKWLDADGNPAPRTAVSFSSNQVFTLQWIEISYDIKIEGTESFNTMNYIASVTRMTGTDDLDDLKLFVVVKYEDSRFLNLYSEITKTDGSSKIRFGAGSVGLEAVYLYVVSGEIGQTFDRYGETSLSYAK